MSTAVCCCLLAWSLQPDWICGPCVPLKCRTPQEPVNYELLFPPRMVTIPAETVAPYAVRHGREMQLRERRRVEAEIATVKAEIAAWNRRLRELENPSRFLYSYAFSMDQEQAKLAILQAQEKLRQLEDLLADLKR